MALNTPSWTPAERELAAGMLRDGLSARQIGALFHLTRNAIIGRVHRDKLLKLIGLSGPRSQGERKPKRLKLAGVVTEPKPVHKIVHNPLPKKERPPVRIGPIKPLSIPLMEMKRAQCKWPVNDPPRGGVFLFCALPSGEGPYCACHTELAYASRAA